MNVGTAEADGSGARADPTLNGAMAHLTEALRIIDSLEISPDIGALVQEAIERLSSLSLESSPSAESE